MYINPQNTKQQMEFIWNEKPCINPLGISCWRLDWRRGIANLIFFRRRKKNVDV